MRRLLLHAAWLTAAAVAAHARDLPAGVALAWPVAGIAVDGDLSDWPAGLPVLPVRREFGAYGPTDLDGVDLGQSDDLSPSLRVGYSAAEQVLYVAVEVRDDELRNPPGGAASRTDACELYVSGLDAGQPLQYAMVPGRHPYVGTESNPALTNGAIGRTETRGAWKRRGDVTTYEWRVQVFDRYPEEPSTLEPGRLLGFDAVVVDADGDGPAAWVPWALPVPAKWSDDRIGRLLLGPESGAADAPLAAREFADRWLQEHGDELEAWSVRRQEGLGFALDAARAADRGAVVALEAAVAALEAGNAGAVIEMPALPPLPPVPPADWLHERSRGGRSRLEVAGACAILVAFGLAAYLARRGGRGRARAADATPLEERIAHIESRLTDTQDVMIALSEKLDRIAAARGDRGPQGRRGRE